MSNEDKWLEELSAYLDGEAADAPGVEEHLRREPALSRRGEDYTRIGALLRSLPEPDVHPAFATRVVAHAVEAGPAPTWRWWQVLVPALGLAAVAVAAFLLQQPEAPAPTQVAETIPAQETITLRKDWTDEENVVGAMEQLIDQGVTFDLDTPEAAVEAEAEEPMLVEAPATPAPETPLEPLTPEWSQEIARDVYAYVSDTYWLSPESEVLWFRPDVEQEVESLSAPEQRLFQELLRTYQENG